MRLPLLHASALLTAVVAGLAAQTPLSTASSPGSRVLLDAHNAYPYNGSYADRLDRALKTGAPLAIEQDLVWRPTEGDRAARSIVSHGEPYDGREPSLRDHFFERIRPLVERAFRERATSEWPVVVLNLDLKSNEPEHHRALWALLGEYESWLTTAPRTADGAAIAPLDIKPVLVLTGESDLQASAFHDDLPVGARLRLFGAMAIRPAAPESDAPAAREAAAATFWAALPAMDLPKATNYRRWWNAPWSVVERGGQATAGEWTPGDDQRLRTLVRRAHAAGLWVRMWTINGHVAGEESTTGWSASYNIGSLAAARTRWRAAIDAGVDFVATDQYEAFTAELPAERPRMPVPRELVLEGTLRADDRLTWLERSFEVPAATARLDVETSHSDRGQGTAIEFGLYDPLRFRGASRTSKTAFFLSRTAATPSYTVGDLPAGTWRLSMGIPSLQLGGSTYRVVVRLTPDGPRQPTPLALPDAAAHTGPRWYQGDLHAHTQHSDGFSCTDGNGVPGPCTVPMVAAAAARRGLDFLAVTDHNTISHHAEMVAEQAQHRGLLLLRGQELTTFYGHANVYGTSEPLDFRIGPRGPTAGAVFREAQRLGGLVSINHPGRETGDRCTGCGWNAPGTDYRYADAIEVVNGLTVSGPTAGEPFWHERLNEGHRLTGIGGGDDHGASTRPGSAVGTPTTAIYADALSEAALLVGLRRGRVFIKTRGPDGPDLRFAAPTFGAEMGDVVRLATPIETTFRVTVLRGEGQRLIAIRNGRELDLPASLLRVAGDNAIDVPVRVAPGDWVRVNVADATGVTVIGNPIYFR